MPFATIDLSGVHWTSVPNGLTYISVNSPTTDPTYHGQSIGVYPPDSWALMPSPTPEIYDAYTAQGGCGGVTYMAQIQQSLASELIAEGASATTGNVNEPMGASGCPDPETILYEYSQGNSLGESAFMGLPVLAWMEVAIGDPLMAPLSVFRELVPETDKHHLQQGYPASAAKMTL